MFLLIKKMVMTIVAAVSIAASACEAVPPPPPFVAPAQAPNTVHLQGDSVTLNTYYQTNLVYDYATTTSMVPGASIDIWGLGGNTEGEPAMTAIPKLVAEGKVDRLIWAMGLNEIWQKRTWSDYHLLLWSDLLYNKIPKSSCIVMVKPWVTPLGNYAIPLSALNSLRAWIDDFATKRPNTVVVDWKPELDAHPEYSPADGIHIALGTGGAEARDAMYRSGLTRCS